MKRSLFSALAVSVFIAFILITLPSCKEGEKRTPIVYTTDIAQIIAQSTAGLIRANDTITVVFVDGMISKNMIGVPLNNNPFSFEPSISGTAQWKDERTLQFKPSKPLAYRQNYSAKLTMKTLFDKWHAQSPQTFDFEFTVAAPELVEYNGDFHLKNQSDPSILFYKAILTFSEHYTVEDVRDSVKLTADGANLELSVEKNAKGEFICTTSDIKRTAKRKIFVFNVNKKNLDLNENYKNTFALEPLGIFVPTGWTVIEDRDHPSFKIQFTDDVDMTQDVTGLIRMEPDMAIKTKITEKSVYISGAFVYGQKYTIVVDKGVRSKWGIKTNQKYSKTIDLKDIKPQLAFSGHGVFLPTANEQVLRFQTINLKSVRVEIKKVFENNLGQFLQTEKLDALRDRNAEFDDYYVQRVGVVVWDTKLEIGNERNRWLQQEIDLKELFKKGDKALYLVSVRFNNEDMLYDRTTGNNDGYSDSYYSDPANDGYVYRHGRIYKPVIQNDIGLTYKKSGNKHLVFATDIASAKPLPGVQVTLFTYQNEKVDTLTTDSNGFADFSSVSKSIYYIVGEKSISRAVIKCNEMGWNLSAFEIGGEKIDASGISAFIYTERGVYRPGDPVNFSVIARQNGKAIADGHPITISVINPKNQTVYTTTSTDGKNGLYVFPFSTRQEDMTGNWRAVFTIGTNSFTHELKVETVVANRLRVNIEPSKTIISQTDKKIDIKISSQYLMGNPAAGLEASLSVRVDHIEKKFKSFPGFMFTNQSETFTPLESVISDGNLQDNGEMLASWDIPDFNNPPSALSAELESRVVERGGRGVIRTVYLPINPYPFYVGIEKPEPGRSYGTIGSAMSFRTICVSTDGTAVSGRQLTYTIYKNSYSWWWEYDEASNRQLRFKSDKNTEKVSEGKISSASQPSSLSYTPEYWGEYLLEIRDAAGHTAGMFFSAYYWGDSAAARKGADIISIKTDKTTYRPGENVYISFPAPAEGTVLISVEKGNKILDARHYPLKTIEGIMRIPVPVTDEMLPNAYISVSVIQPHAQTVNDRPIRVYGVVPITVEDPRTHHNVIISAPDRLAPNEQFSIDVQTADKLPTQFTIAVVDEGLLDLTDFKTPNPWKWFFRREALSVTTFDLYDSIIGANKGDVYKRFSVGGDMDAYRLGQQGEKVQRFKPVCLFKGPITTDKNGYSRVTFDMPNYIGSVRVMVIASDNNRYGITEKPIPVKTPLMIMPTLPRFIGSGDVVNVPVTVFATEADVKNVSVNIAVEGPVTVTGEKRKHLTFSKIGDDDVFFSLKADSAIGKATITITATSGSYKAKETIEIAVQHPAPRIFQTITRDGKPGQTTTLTVPGSGIEGSNTALIRISRIPKIDLGRRLTWLIHYPYGCVEQTTSSVFPQLYLKDIVKTSEKQAKSIDANINAAIQRLTRFQLPSGGFSYWPGAKDVNIWGTNYAGHFLYEAKQAGYSVPESMLTEWLKFQKSRAQSSDDTFTERVYRLYLLALAGSPQMGPMNIIRENHIKKLSNLDRWLLGGAYKLAGSEKVALEIIREATFNIKEYNEFGGTYGSAARDKAMMLDILMGFKDWKNVRSLFDELALRLESEEWYSTQTSAYMLLAMGKYMRSMSGDKNERKLLDGTITLTDGAKVPFSTEDITFSIPIEKDFGKSVSVAFSSKTNVPMPYVTVEWSGIPAQPILPTTSENLTLSINAYTEDGIRFDPTTTTQGDRFWAHIAVTRTDKNSFTIENCALVQILPAGWEIENTRLSGEDIPSWADNLVLNRETYTDIRDDRIMWFFDYPRREQRIDFLVKINAVTSGTFTLPSTLVEAMYNNKFRATFSGRKVTVKQK